MTVRAAATAILLGLVACACAGDVRTRDAPVLVAAASDLRGVLEEILEPGEATITYGSSGQLAAQIAEGGPFELFLSADRQFVDVVIDAGAGDPGTARPYAFGRLAIWAQQPVDLAGLGSPEIATIAIANPEHAPYGRAAVQALRSAGVWPAVADRLVYGVNVADARRIADSGNADAGIVALSLVIHASGGVFTEVDEAMHVPLEQILVVTTRDPGRARAADALAQRVTSDAGRTVLGRFGFGLP